ncbi:MAG: hypothetical protein AAF614_25595 [Chloroflexota bacterium]
MNQTKPVNRGAYLVRFWRDDVGAPWQFLVEEVATRQQYRFADFSSLVLFFEEGLGAQFCRVSMARLWLRLARQLRMTQRAIRRGMGVRRRSFLRTKPRRWPESEPVRF